MTTALSCHCHVFETKLGWMALAIDDSAEGPRLLEMTYGQRSRRAAEGALRQHLDTRKVQSNSNANSGDNLQAFAEQLAERLEAFCSGEPDLFLDVTLEESALTPFARQVTARCRQIPWGRTMSYGELAEACGRPRAARAVGSVMAKNRWPLIVPCHRVLGAGGALGGYSAPQGVSMKRRLLDLEAFE